MFSVNGNLVTMQKMLMQHAPIFKQPQKFPYVIVSYLPLCHIAEQIMTNVMSLLVGGQVYFCPDLAAVKEHLVEARPTVFAAVPRVWEKFQAAMMLDWLGERHGDTRLKDGARLIERAVEQVFSTGQVRPFEFGGTSGTADITRAVIGALQ